MLVGFVKYLPSARMDCTIPQFTVSCSRCAVSCDLLRLDWLSSDSVKYKGTSCVQGIEYAAQNRQKRKQPCAAFNTQRRAVLCCRFLIAFAPLLFLSCFMQGCHLTRSQTRPTSLGSRLKRLRLAAAHSLTLARLRAVKYFLRRACRRRK